VCACACVCVCVCVCVSVCVCVCVCVRVHVCVSIPCSTTLPCCVGYRVASDARCMGYHAAWDTGWFGVPCRGVCRAADRQRWLKAKRTNERTHAHAHACTDTWRTSAQKPAAASLGRMISSPPDVSAEYPELPKHSNPALQAKRAKARAALSTQCIPSRHRAAQAQTRTR
jgi:hypothetical protein